MRLIDALRPILARAQHDDEALAMLDAAPTAPLDAARLRAIIVDAFERQGLKFSRDSRGRAMLSTIALAVDDIMEYLGAKATE